VALDHDPFPLLHVITCSISTERNLTSLPLSLCVSLHASPSLSLSRSAYSFLNIPSLLGSFANIVLILSNLALRSKTRQLWRATDADHAAGVP